jgi:hypothetical protein
VSIPGTVRFALGVVGQLGPSISGQAVGLILPSTAVLWLGAVYLIVSTREAAFATASPLRWPRRTRRARPSAG